MDTRRIRTHLGILMVLALIALSACDQLKQVYCTNVVPVLSKPCSQPVPVLPPVTGGK